MSLMTVGIGVFKKKYAHLWQHMHIVLREKKRLDYIALVHTILIIYTLVIHYARKQSLVIKKINLHSHILWKYSIKQLLVSFLFKLHLPKRIFIAIEDSLLILHKVLHYLNVRKKTYCVEWNITPYNEVPNYIFVRC